MTTREDAEQGVGNAANPRHFIVAAIKDGAVVIVGSYRDKKTAVDSAYLSNGSVLDVEFWIEDSPYGQGIVHFVEWLA